MVDLSPTTLISGTPFNGSMTETGYARLFKIDVAQAGPLQIILDNADNSQRTEIYARLATPPTRQAFQYRTDELGADHSLLIPLASPGAWYILAYGSSNSVPSAFTLTAVFAPFFVTDVTPNQYPTNQVVSLTVHGAGFVPGTQIELVSGGATTYPAQSVVINGTERVSATLNLNGIPQGTYDVRVTLPGGSNQSLANAFQVLPPGQAKLETNLILPSAFGRHSTATIYVEYANTGTATMPAPILTLKSTDANDSDRPLLTLDQSRLTSGFWTSVKPDGFDFSVQIYATGETPGVLQPGERIQVPVYYAGLLQPWDFGDNQVELQIFIRDANNSELVDWSTFADSARPENVADDAWQTIIDNLATTVGPTWGDYISMLSDNARYLENLGRRVINVDALFRFEFQQANGLSSLGVLASSVDAAIPASGLDFAYSRSFGNTITERYRMGPFGRGWSAPWFAHLDISTDGSVTIFYSADSSERFQPDSRYAGKFLGAPDSNNCPPSRNSFLLCC